MFSTYRYCIKGLLTAACALLLSIMLVSPVSAVTKEVKASDVQTKGVMLRMEDVVKVHFVKGSVSENGRVSVIDVGRIQQGNTAPKLSKGYMPLSNVYNVGFSGELRKKAIVDIHVNPSTEKQEKNRWTVFFRTSKTDWRPLPTLVNAETNTVRFLVPENAGQIVVGYHVTEIQPPVKAFTYKNYTGLQYSAAATVQDFDTGAFLYRRNATTPRSIASISKVATVYTFLQKNPDLDRTVTYRSSAKREGAVVYLADGEQMTAKSAVMGALMPSANNVAVQLMQNSGLSERDFVRRMNTSMKSMKLNQTTFVEPTGLNPANKASADNVSRMFREVTTQYPNIFKEAATARVYHYETGNTKRGINLYTTNKFSSSLYTVEAFKTGYLPGTADRTLVVTLKEKTSGKKIIVTLLGNPQYGTIFDEAQQMADWAFRNWEFADDPSF